MIRLININKKYRIQERRSGLSGIIKDLINPKYSEINALNNISLSIKKGEKIGIVGKNGSGKSTLIKLLSGVLRPTTGEIYYYEKNIFGNLKNFKKNIALMFGQRSQLYQNMIFSESLELYRLIYGMSKSKAKQRIDLLVELLSLQDILKKTSSRNVTRSKNEV